MSNEDLVRKLIRGSIHRAIQESVAAVVVWIAFGIILRQQEVGSAPYYGCLLVLIGTGFIVGVVWSYTLSYRTLRTHSADDASFWREAFQSQAKLLRLVPLWYCAPLGLGFFLFIVPLALVEPIAFLMVASIFSAIITGVIWLNRKTAVSIDDAALLAGCSPLAPIGMIIESAAQPAPQP